MNSVIYQYQKVSHNDWTRSPQMKTWK